MKRSAPRRDWREARAKVQAEGNQCRNCGLTQQVECAHVLGREHDHYTLTRERIPQGETLTVWPERIVPLCGPVGDPGSCHAKQHAHDLDCLMILTPQEQAQAVIDAGGIEAARIRLSPMAYPERKVAV